MESRYTGTTLESNHVGTSVDESDAALHVIINDMKHTLTRRLDQLATDNEILKNNQQELKKENYDIKRKINELASQNEQLKSNQVRSDTAMAQMKLRMKYMELHTKYIKEHKKGMGPQTMELNQGGENLRIFDNETEHRQEIQPSPSDDAHNHETLPASHHVTRPCDDAIEMIKLQVDQVNTKMSKVMTQNKEITAHLQELLITSGDGNSGNTSHEQGRSLVCHKI